MFALIYDADELRLGMGMDGMKDEDS